MAMEMERDEDGDGDGGGGVAAPLSLNKMDHVTLFCSVVRLRRL
jgi:hypothetical protein